MFADIRGIRPVAVVADVDCYNGAPLARRFADAGYDVALLACRFGTLDPFAEQIPGVRCFPCDVGSSQSVSDAFGNVRREMGEVDALIYNAGSSVFVDLTDPEPEQYGHAWRDISIGANLCAREVIPAMEARGDGTIIFVGDTETSRDELKMSARTPAEAGRRPVAETMAMEAQRFLAESMAERLGPARIHVARIVIDGVLDLPRTRQMMPDKSDAFFVAPASVAEIAYQLSCQPHWAWTFEVAARPASQSLE